MRTMFVHGERYGNEAMELNHIVFTAVIQFAQKYRNLSRRDIGSVAHGAVEEAVCSLVLDLPSLTRTPE